MGERRKKSERLAADVREVVGGLVRRLRSTFAEERFSMSQAQVLSRLIKHGPSTVADLARAERVKPQSMGSTVASLEEEGFVVRTADPADARRWHASITENGRRVFLEGRAARQAWLSQAIHERLDEDEQKRAADGVAILRKLLDE